MPSCENARATPRSRDLQSGATFRPHHERLCSIARINNVQEPATGKTQPVKASMIAIILSACLVSDPQICRDHHIVLTPEVADTRCMRSAMPYVTQWSEEHPQWRIVRWQCRPASDRDT
jgi:hypothetical protein